MENKSVVIVGNRGFREEDLKKALETAGEAAQVWSCCDNFQIPGVRDSATHWFDLSSEFSDEKKSFFKEFLERGGVLFLRENEVDGVPARKFPVERVCALPVHKYFNDIYCHMVGMSNVSQVSRLTLVGLDRAKVRDPFADGATVSRPSLEYHLGLFLGRGGDLDVPSGSDILRPAWLYPFEHDQPMAQKIEGRRIFLAQAMSNATASEKANRRERMKAQGAIDNIKYMGLNLGNCLG